MFGCVHLPDFSRQAVRRGEPELGGRALTEVRGRSPAPEVAAHAALLDLGWSFSPRLEARALDTIIVDLVGLGTLAGPLPNVARRMAERAAELGFEANVAVASNPDAAECAARGFRGATWIAPGAEAERLSVLPVEVLAPPAEMLETLGRWGVATLGALAALPSLSERLGEEGLRLQSLARGAAVRALVPASLAAHFEETLELDYPVTELEPLAFILGRLLAQLGARLKARALATNEIRMHCEMETVEALVVSEAGNTKHERTLRLPVPTRDSKLLLKLWLLKLQSDPPQAPVRKVTLAAEPANPRVAQGELFLPLSPHPEKLELTLARIAGVVGPSNVGVPELVDSRRPDAFKVRRFVGAGGNLKSRARTESPDPRSETALRIFRPPLAAVVETRQGRPTHVDSVGGVRGNVITASGPWRTSGDWWREDGWQQEEWDVSVVRNPFSVVQGELASSGGEAVALYRIYRDQVNGKWFVRGSYD